MNTNRPGSLFRGLLYMAFLIALHVNLEIHPDHINVTYDIITIM